ncbi:MAG TPA: hypothetical protein VHJ17_02620 [Thermomonospora sp.]|nr:hypothetical protein [Thermomonospora sp.]
MTAIEVAPTDTPVAEARLVIEYWTVAMGDASCDTCDSTLATLTGAVETLGPLAGRLGITLEVVPRTVSTWAQALEHEITASPTIRAAGVTLRPSHPDDTERRLWTWRGRTGTALPQEAVLDTLLQALAAHSSRIGDYLAQGGPSGYLRRFLSAPASAPSTRSAPCESGTACS